MLYSFSNIIILLPRYIKIILVKLVADLLNFWRIHKVSFSIFGIGILLARYIKKYLSYGALIFDLLINKSMFGHKSKANERRIPFDKFNLVVDIFQKSYIQKPVGLKGKLYVSY